jgi:excinuclease ABC subunit C
MLDTLNLPNEPGCYLFKDKNENVIYIGKAKNLRKRIKQYLQKNDFDIKTKSMLNLVDSLDFVATDNEIEALILENTLIKKYQPKYNIRLKDAKTHSYILLTDEDFPRTLIARRKNGKGKYFGPFISAQERDYILQFIKRTFLLRTCNKIPKKACLRYHINLCDAPCIGLISKEDYDKKIENIKLFLTGHVKKLIKKLQTEMKNYSDKFNFENALILRNRITALKHLTERQNMLRDKKYNEDIINYEIKDDKVYLMLFNIYKGTLHNKNEFIFDYIPGFLQEFIIQYYSEKKVPKELIVPIKLSKSISDFLENKRGNKVKIIKPEKGEKKHLLNLVLKNIDITFFVDIDKVKTLKNKLNLQENPNVIECFDISHLSGTSTAGSMVQFRNGKPDKSNYRRFRIRSIDGIDDTAAIAEIVRRRYLRLKTENAELPNLIIIDGGIGQLNYALQELVKLDLKIPIISIAKQFEEIFTPGKMQPLRILKKDKALQFIQEIRDEAHRFALKYNQLLRKKELIS